MNIINLNTFKVMHCLKRDYEFCLSMFVIHTAIYCNCFTDT